MGDQADFLKRRAEPSAIHRDDVVAADGPAGFTPAAADYYLNSGSFTAARVWVNFTHASGAGTSNLTLAFWMREHEGEQVAGRLVESPPNGVATPRTLVLLQVAEGWHCFDLLLNSDDLFVEIYGISGSPTTPNVDVYVSGRPGATC